MSLSSYYFNKKTKVVVDTSQFQFNNYDRLLKTSYYNIEDSMFSFTKYEYDYSNFVKALNIYKTDSSHLYSKYIYSYDKLNRISRVEFFNASTEELDRFESYNYKIPDNWEKGNFVLDYFAPTNYFCDSSGKISGAFCADNISHIKRCIKYFYDPNGRLQQYVSNIVVDSNDYDYKYYSMKTPKEKLHDLSQYNFDIKYIYDHFNNIISEIRTNYDKSRITVSMYAYQLDERNNWTIRKETEVTKVFEKNKYKQTQKLESYSERKIAYY